MLKNKISRFSVLIILAIILQNCYTHVETPNYRTLKKQSKETNSPVNFTYSVIDTFDNDWFPDEGYYYEYRPQSNKRIKEDKIDLFLNMLYAKGYNIVGAWYRPSWNDCGRYKLLLAKGEQNSSGRPEFIILLSDVNDSIIEYDFYPLLRKPEIICPYNVEEYWVE